MCETNVPVVDAATTVVPLTFLLELWDPPEGQPPVCVPLISCLTIPVADVFVVTKHV